MTICWTDSRIWASLIETRGSGVGRCTVGHIELDRALIKLDPHETALRFEVRSITYAELEQRVARRGAA
jgi:hypothetical protein